MPALEYNTLVVLVGTTVLGAAAGVIGSFALLRRRALLGDALSHATLPGICLAFLLFGRREFAVLLLGALSTGLLGVLVVAALSRYTRIKEDASIGIVLSVFFGAGVVLSGLIQKHSQSGAQAGIDSFILGHTAGMVRADVYFITGAAVLVLLVVALLYKELKILCFDPDFASVEGWPVLKLDFALMMLLTVTTVIGLPAVGVVLMVALLVIPAAAARLWTRRLTPMLAVAGGVGMVTGASGTLISASTKNLPAGPIIVLCGSAVFALSLLFAPHRGLIARWRADRTWIRQRRMQRFLRGLFELGESGEATDTPWDELPTVLHISPRESRALRRRATKHGWLSADATRATLTDRGRVRAARVVRAQRLWDLYLLDHADIDRDLVDPSAELIESVLPTNVVADLERQLEAAGRLPTQNGAAS